jgi:hypothetical protein
MISASVLSFTGGIALAIVAVAVFAVASTGGGRKVSVFQLSGGPTKVALTIKAQPTDDETAVAQKRAVVAAMGQALRLDYVFADLPISKRLRDLVSRGLSAVAAASLAGPACTARRA